MKVLLTLLIFFTLSPFEQDIYIRNKDEDIQTFITRCFPETKDNIVHQIIEGKWGDTSHAKKIVVFYKNYEHNETKAIVLQLISGNKYERLIFDHSFGIGIYYSGSKIESVFFYDTNDDGLKELIVIESGVVRCPVDIIEYNEETGMNDTIATYASCGDCGYAIFGQKFKSERIEVLDGNEDPEWQCDAAFIKELLEEKKKH